MLDSIMRQPRCASSWNPQYLKAAGAQPLSKALEEGQRRTSDSIKDGKAGIQQSDLLQRTTKVEADHS